MNALFHDDVPTLIKELKETHTFTDFFGFWRRDHDLARKLGKELTPTKSRNTVTSSVLSEFFFASSPSLSDVHHLSTRQRSQYPFTHRLSTVSDTSSSESSVTPPVPQRTAPRRMVPPSSSYNSPSRTSALASSSASTPPRHVTPASRQPSIALQDIPIRFGHVPEALISDRPTSMLESLPEDCEVSGPAGKIGDHSSRSRRRAGSMASEVNRGARVYGSHTNLRSLSNSDENQPDYSCKWSYIVLAVFLNPRSLSAAAAKVFMADDGILPGCGLPRRIGNRLFPTDASPREQSHAEGIDVHYIICHDRGPCGCCHSTLATSHGVISPTPRVWSAGRCLFGRRTLGRARRARPGG